ncbi:hypothetical protein BaRGS_00035241, partial [Batillaria attramentaria]
MGECTYATLIFLGVVGVCMSSAIDPCDKSNETDVTFILQWDTDTRPYSVCECNVASETQQTFDFTARSPYLDTKTPVKPILQIFTQEKKETRTILPSPTPAAFNMTTNTFITKFEVLQNGSDARQRLTIEAPREFRLVCSGRRNVTLKMEIPSSPDNELEPRSNETKDLLPDILLASGSFMGGVIFTVTVICTRFLCIKIKRRRNYERPLPRRQREMTVYSGLAPRADQVMAIQQPEDRIYSE